MGNTNGRVEESKDNGGREGNEVVVENRSPVLDSRQSRSPLLFSSQTPVVSVSRNDGQSWQNGSQSSVDQPVEIPIIISWSFGADNVMVEGSWDNWRSRKILQRSGKDHSILLMLPSGLYRYLFIVDGEVKCIPDLPSEFDEMKGFCNLLDVHDYVPETLDSVAEFKAPPSPISSYSQIMLGDEDFAKDPMMVPPQLEATMLNSNNHKEGASSSKPQHVALNHLFVDKGSPSQLVVALGLTHRFQSKYVTVVLYKPLKR